jgi:iron complex outermembrane receptor protein
MNKFVKGAIPVGSLLAVMNTGVVLAADAAGSSDTIDEVIVTGTREAGIKAVDSPTPIQVVSADALKATGAPDLMAAISALVPSLQLEAFGFDMAGQTLQARLRGVSPNDVLVLINGKRRHTTANLAVDTGSPFQGGAGVDLNFIPLDAIDHVEVLTDGAAAQYGSDAIAGVVNVILKKNNSGGVLNGTYGQYGNNGGGKTGDVSGNVGLDPGTGGYFSVTGDFRTHGHSNFGAVDPRLLPGAQTSYPNSNVYNVPGSPNLNLIQGDAAVQTKLLSVNAGFDFDGGTELYFTGTYGHKEAASYENYRMPNKANFTPSVATPDPVTGATSGPTEYPFPLGFNPQEQNIEDDYQLTGGIKGSAAGWNWDVATGFGGDKDSLSTLNSLNTGYYNTTGILGPTNFYDGFLKATQWTSTADISHGFDIGWSSPLNFAAGVEYRRETYSIGAGVPISYIIGGASSYPGFTPLDQASNSRDNKSVYIDFAGKPIDALQVDAAVRFEKYSDFGSTTIGKLNARYDFSPEFAIRGAINNGFRAPTLAEEFYSSTNVGPKTAYVQLPPNSPAGKLLGLGNGLQPEKSVDVSLGFVWRPIDHMSVTLDAYQIAINNRIVGSGNVIGQNAATNFQNCVNNVPGNLPSPTGAFAGVNAAIAAYARGQNVIDPDVIKCGTYGIAVFANGIDTKTRGADLVFQFPYEYSFGKINWSIAANYNKTSLEKVPATPALLAGATLYDAQALSYLTDTSPKYVVDLGAALVLDKLTVNLHEKIYGPTGGQDNDQGDVTGSFIYYNNPIGTTGITNLDVSYQFTDRLKLAVGAQNLFNKFPPLRNGNILNAENAAGDNAAVQQYPIFTPWGNNGGFYYVKAQYKF